MFALAVSGIAFVCAVGAALFGMFLQTRLPRDHFNTESMELVKLVLAVLGTLTALVLGLLVASAKDSLDSKVEQLKLVATRTVQLDRTLAEYGPETRELRHLLRQLVEARIHELWQGKGLTEEEVRQALGRGRGIETIQRRLLDLIPQNDAQHWFRTAALDITNDIAKARWTAFLNLGRSIQAPFLVMLVFWLTAIFASFGIFAPRNGNVIATLVVGALSVAGAIFLIVEMDHPISGLVRVPMAPVEAAWEQLDKP